MWLVLFALLIITSIIDAKTRTIPNALVVACILNRVIWVLVLQEPIIPTLQTMLLSEIVPVFILISTVLFDKIRGGSSMGGGDIKLLFAMALYVNWIQILVTLMIACILSLVWALIRKQRDFPFAPALTIGFAIAILM